MVTISLFNTSGESFSSSKFNSGNNRLKHFIAASLHKYSESAPTNPCVIAATRSCSTSVSRGLFLFPYQICLAYATLGLLHLVCLLPQLQSLCLWLLDHPLVTKVVKLLSFLLLR